MRKLSEKEKSYVIEKLKAQTQLIHKLMNFFRVFGSLQILAVILYILFGNVNPTEIPVMLIACFLLFLVYFKFTGFLAKQNIWNKMLLLIKKGQESAFDCELIRSYTTSHGDAQSSKEYMANVNLAGREFQCNAFALVMEKEPGTKVVMVCDSPNPEKSFRFVFAAGDCEARR